MHPSREIGRRSEFFSSAPSDTALEAFRWDRNRKSSLAELLKTEFPTGLSQEAVIEHVPLWTASTGWGSYVKWMDALGTTPISAVDWSDWNQVPFAPIRQAIQASREMLDLPDDWDEEGSPQIQVNTWDRATIFVSRTTWSVFSSSGVVIDAPHISPGPEGSIDIHWNSDDYELLVNIPHDASRPAEFYGDDRSSFTIRGTLDPSTINQGLMQWLRNKTPAP